MRRGPFIFVVLLMTLLLGGASASTCFSTNRTVRTNVYDAAGGAGRC